MSDDTVRVPREPTERMIDYGVAFALNATPGKNASGWTEYIKLFWERMLAAAPTPEQNTPNPSEARDMTDAGDSAKLVSDDPKQIREVAYLMGENGFLDVHDYLRNYANWIEQHATPADEFSKFDELSAELERDHPEMMADARKWALDKIAKMKAEQHATPSSATSDAVAWIDPEQLAEVAIEIPHVKNDYMLVALSRCKQGDCTMPLYASPHPIERQAVTDEMVERACDAFAPLNMNDGRPLDLWPTLTREYLRKNVRAALEAALNG